ncbi:MAG: hypothetical protein SOW20_05045 [Berryella intestinalis]|uniref:bile acid:sodium symporter family protein n=1 Tax=Berryella intestinalis TaxID=1531429 RepID=UPI002A75E41A|nr:hypothetical protein [Berryella intestinalis]MDY3129371.1 hypothetical protein [Berryella intestinalis]
MNAQAAHDAWLHIGRFIGRHMPIVILASLAAGIAFPDQLGSLRPFVPLMFAVMTFQNSLTISFSKLKQAITSPAPIIMVLLFAHAVMPVAAFGAGSLLFSGESDIIAGLVLEYSVPVATSMVMWVSLSRGNTATSLAILLGSTLICPFSIPFTLHALLGASIEVNAVGMIGDMLFMVAIPALAGFGLNEATRGWAGRKLAFELSPLARLLIPLIVTVNTTGIAVYVRNPTPQLVAIVVFVGLFAAGAFLIGIGLAKATHRKNAEFAPVAFGCGMRNISAGSVIAASYFPAETIFPVMAGVLFQQLLAATFGKIISRMTASKNEEASARA